MRKRAFCFFAIQLFRPFFFIFQQKGRYVHLFYFFLVFSFFSCFFYKGVSSFMFFLLYKMFLFRSFFLAPFTNLSTAYMRLARFFRSPAGAFRSPVFPAVSVLSQDFSAASSSVFAFFTDVSAASISFASAGFSFRHFYYTKSAVSFSTFFRVFPYFFFHGGASAGRFLPYGFLPAPENRFLIRKTVPDIKDYS